MHSRKRPRQSGHRWIYFHKSKHLTIFWIFESDPNFQMSFMVFIKYMLLNLDAFSSICLLSIYKWIDIFPNWWTFSILQQRTCPCYFLGDYLLQCSMLKEKKIAKIKNKIPILEWRKRGSYLLGSTIVLILISLIVENKRNCLSLMNNKTLLRRHYLKYTRKRVNTNL